MATEARSAVVRSSRDYPWSSLDVLRPADLKAMRALRGAFADIVDLPAALSAVATQTRSRVVVRLRRSITTVPTFAAGDVGVLLAPADSNDTTRAFFVGVEGLLAASLVARVLEQKPPRIADASAPVAPVIAGAFAAILVRVARREGTVPLRVIAAGSAATFARDLAAASGSFIGASFTALVDDDAFLAHVLVARARVGTVASAPLTRADLARSGAIPIAIPIVAKVLTLPVAEIASLRVGDALVVPAWPLLNGVGAILFAAGTSEVGVTGEFETATRLVLRGETSSLSWSAEEDAGDPSMTERDPLVKAVGEVPVVVRVEIGTAQMTAREWSQLGPGDVLTLGRRVKDPVTIRVSGVEVARGELVDVEGAVGVRILSITKDAS
ncbi:hypothetical protein BH09MYX1_BH09MYX1_17560 [soil metagenome]